jgi:hypothetical protein
MDLTWEGFGPAIPEPNQFIRQGNRVMFDTQRLAQMGSWSGTLEVAGQSLTVGAETTWGSRDRSWGVRPVGEKEPEGIRVGERTMGGMWSYFPMRFEDHCIYYICSEAPDGTRSLEQAERVWLDGRVEQLGRTDHDHHFSSDVPRLLDHSTISFPDAGFEIEVQSLLPNYLAIGTGYGFEEDWRHGMYQGPDPVVQGVVHDVADIQQMGSYAVVDHAARFTYQGHVGYGLYEHAFSGSMPKYGLQ